MAERASMKEKESKRKKEGKKERRGRGGGTRDNLGGQNKMIGIVNKFLKFHVAMLLYNVSTPRL